jgi:hypothetical protein
MSDGRPRACPAPGAAVARSGAPVDRAPAVDWGRRLSQRCSARPRPPCASPDAREARRGGRHSWNPRRGHSSQASADARTAAEATRRCAQARSGNAWSSDPRRSSGSRSGGFRCRAYLGCTCHVLIDLLLSELLQRLGEPCPLSQLPALLGGGGQLLGRDRLITLHPELRPEGSRLFDRFLNPAFSHRLLPFLRCRLDRDAPASIERIVSRRAFPDPVRAVPGVVLGRRPGLAGLRVDASARLSHD